MSRTVLIMHPGTLGDVILALPAIRALRCSYPTHRLGLLAGQSVGRFLVGSGEVQTAFALERGMFSEWLADPTLVTGPLPEWILACDLAVCWLEDGDRRLADAFRSAGVPRTIIKSPNAYAEGSHQTERFLRTIRSVTRAAVNADVVSLPSHVTLAAQAMLAAMGLHPRRAVCLHPGSGSPQKCVHPAVLVPLVNWCHVRGLEPFIVGGPCDDDQVEALQCTVGGLPVLQEVDLTTVAGVVAQCRLFVGQDSGLSHVAAALGAPTITLFGPTDPKRWAPRGPCVAVVTGDPCRCGGWEAVRHCIERPCLRIRPEDLCGRAETVLAACSRIEPPETGPCLVLP